MRKYISLPIFIISLSIGLLAVYILGEDRKVVYVYPTPENQETTKYRDLSGGCFKYKLTPVDCKDAKNVVTVPIQL